MSWRIDGRGGGSLCAALPTRAARCEEVHAPARAAARRSAARAAADTTTAALGLLPLLLLALRAFRAMADATIAAIVALQKRANEHASPVKCGFAAAAEKLQEAVVLAQRLPGLPEDNLVVLYLQVERCKFLGLQAARYTLSGVNAESAECQGFANAASSSLLLVTAALFRRMDAGTLQPGRCAPLEEAWFTAYSTTMFRSVTDKRLLLRYGQLVGLATLYDAAEETLKYTLYMESFGSVEQASLTLVARALDALYKPRPLEEMPIITETALVCAMLSFQENIESNEQIERITASHLACSRLLQQIGDAWARVQASGVLQRRELHEAGADMSSAIQRGRRNREAADARQARRGLRSCGLDSCGATEAHLDHFKRCSACKAIVYCCREHQVADWPAHKAACKAARKAAAADDKQ
jgi:hypothetical protein